MPAIVPGPNFFLQDVSGGALAAALLTPVFVSLGYALGWALDVRNFRRRTLAARLALAVMLSVAVGPILTYLLARAASLGAAVGVYALVTLALLTVGLARAIRVRDRQLAAVPDASAASMLRWGAAAALAWGVYALLQTSDLQFGDRLYTSPIAFDYAKHISVTDAIARTGLPPVNPSFLPGHPIALYYYYFWFLLCSLVVTATGAAVNARDAVLGGTVWGGIVLMAAVSVYARDLRTAADRQGRGAVRVALALLAVGGLDILPVAARSVREFVRHGDVKLLPSVEWWNEQVTSWLSALIWVPHHVAALVATLTALLLLREAAARPRPAQRWALALACGLALASALGLSVWVTLSFAAFWGVWVAVAFARGWRTEARLGVAAGAFGAVLALPFLRDLQRANLAPAQRPVGLAVRAFRPLDAWLDAHDVYGLRRAAARLVALPLNYGLELGFFAVAAVSYWAWRRRRTDPLSRDELALTTLAATSVVVSTFVAAKIRYNDLAPRGMMAAQFVFLLWATDVCLPLLERRTATAAGSPGRRSASLATALLVTLVVGIVTNAYDPIVLRFYPMLLEHGVSTWDDVPRLAPVNGASLYAVRDALWRAGRRLPASAIVQPNPRGRGGVDAYTHLYALRQFAAADPEYGALYGVPLPLYDSVSRPIARAFGDSVAPGDAGPPDPGAFVSLCRRFGVNAWLATSADPVWHDAGSWVWRGAPLTANRLARVVSCPSVR